MRIIATGKGTLRRYALGRYGEATWWWMIKYNEGRPHDSLAT